MCDLTLLDEPEAARRTLGADNATAKKTVDAMAHLVEELQVGSDEHDTNTYNRHFADDVLRRSPFGATVHGDKQLHAIHGRPHTEGREGPSSRSEIMGRCPHPERRHSTSGMSRSIPTAIYWSRPRMSPMRSLR